MKVIDYSNTIMYKLVPNDVNLDLIYIGSTTNFRARKAQHKEACNNSNGKKYNSKVYKMIRDNGGWSEWSMIEIEKYSCADSNESRKRERELMEQYNANLNTNKPYISPEEAIAFQKIYQPIYRAKHLEEYKQYQTEYKITHQNEIQQYRDAHKDKTREYNANYYNTNKEILVAKQREKRLQQKKLASLNLEN